MSLYLRIRLAVEFALLFFALPVLVVLDLVPNWPLQALIAAGSVMFWLLYRDPDFPREQLWNKKAVSVVCRAIVIRWFIIAAILTASVIFFLPESFLSFPKNRPQVWLMVMLLYPLLSVYPQEIIFRAFLFHRYRELFHTDTATVIASAASFGFAHIIFEHWFSVAATCLAGYMFARTYLRSRSLLAVSFEHALYGDLIFTLGLGQFFYHRAVE